MLYTLQPPTGLKVWNTSPNFRYRQETVRLHFHSPSENVNTTKGKYVNMYRATVSIEKEKEKQSKEKRVKALCVKKSSL